MVFIRERHTMKKITREMLQIYKPISELDWMNYRITRKADLTYHHILKRCDGGIPTLENGALLLPIPHQYLHLIEYRDSDTYKMLNKVFEIVNKQQYEPTKDQREIIEYLLQDFEYHHRWDKTSKGKLLIKRKYTEREKI